MKEREKETETEKERLHVLGLVLVLLLTMANCPFMANAVSCHGHVNTYFQFNWKFAATR